MAFHLEGPWLTTTGKKKGKQKFRTADQARQARENRDSWTDMMQRYGIEQEETRRARAMRSGDLAKSGYKLEVPAGRNTTAHLKSVDTGVGVAALSPSKVYTGTACKGIGTMHKSNMVPIFSHEEAVAISKMRR